MDGNSTTMLNVTVPPPVVHVLPASSSIDWSFAVEAGAALLVALIPAYLVWLLQRLHQRRSVVKLLLAEATGAITWRTRLTREAVQGGTLTISHFAPGIFSYYPHNLRKEAVVGADIGRLSTESVYMLTQFYGTIDMAHSAGQRVQQLQGLYMNGPTGIDHELVEQRFLADLEGYGRDLAAVEQILPGVILVLEHEQRSPLGRLWHRRSWRRALAVATADIEAASSDEADDA